MNTCKSTAQQRLKQSFLEAVEFLKKTQFKNKQNQQNLFQSPWHLFIGTKEAGTSTLLGQAEIAYTLARKKNFTAQHDDPNWWVSKSAVLLDLPSCYFDEKQDLLKALIKLLRTKSYEKRIHSLNVVIKLNEILEKSERELESFTTALAKRIQPITKTFSYKMPLYIIISQCDALPGFKAFFSHSTKEERQQAFGITLTEVKTQNIQEQLEIEFDNLISQLSKQIVWRLYHEPENLKRILIKDFPQTFSKTKSRLMKFSQLLFSVCEKDAIISGIYFVSAEQNPLTDKNYQSDKKNLSLHFHGYSKPFFIHDLITKIISPTKIRKQRPYKSYLFYTILGLAALAIMLIFTINFAHDEKNVGKAEIALEKHSLLQAEQNPSLMKSLNNLSQIEKIANQFNHKNFWQVLTPEAFQDRALNTKLETIYKKTEQRLVVPAMLQSLELILKNYNSVDPALLYRTIKTYLMLNQKQHFNKTYVINTMQLLWKNIKNKPQMLEALSNALNSLAPLKINPLLVLAARSALSALPKPALGYIILSSNFSDNVLTLNLTNDRNANQVFTFDNAKVGISKIYTLNTLHSLTKQAFQRAATTALKGNWVLTQVTPNQETPVKLAKQLERIYLENYAKNWLAFISNIKLRQFTSIKQLSQALSTLSGQRSPLVQFFTLIEKNITPQVFNANPELHSLILSFNHSYQTINTSLSRLNDYINNASTPQQAFVLSKQRMLNQGRNDPITDLLNLSRSMQNPLAYWLYQLAQNAWQLIMNQTNTFVNNTWRKTVYSTYQSQIKNRYPFSPYATETVSLNSFINFFSSTGEVNSFFKSYLQDFINTNKATWHAIALNDLKFNISNAMLHIFQTAAAINQTFFPLHDQALFIPFTLKAKMLSNNLVNVTFQLGKQKAVFTSKKHQPLGFQWPDSTNKVLLQITFTNNHNQKQKIVVHGPWAMWRFMQRCHLIPVAKQSGQWQGSVKNDNETMQFVLTTKQKRNPFSLSTFQDFHLRSNL